MLHRQEPDMWLILRCVDSGSIAGGGIGKDQKDKRQGRLPEAAWWVDGWVDSYCFVIVITPGE